MSDKSPDGNDDGHDAHKAHARQIAIAEMIANAIVALPGSIGTAGFKTSPARGFAIGTMIVCVVTVALGNVANSSQYPFYALGFGTALYAGLAGLACGGLWWTHKAGPLPMPLRRALFLAGAVSLSVLSCTVVTAILFEWGQMRAGSALGSALLGILGAIVIYAVILNKFAIIFVALMVGWTLVWRFVVNASAERRATDASESG